MPSKTRREWAVLIARVSGRIVLGGSLCKPPGSDCEGFEEWDDITID